MAWLETFVGAVVQYVWDLFETIKLDPPFDFGFMAQLKTWVQGLV